MDIAEKIKLELISQFPSLEQSIQILDSWTPYTYTEYFNSYIGSYMGFTFTKKSNLKDIPIKLKNLKNLYLATFWQRHLYNKKGQPSGQPIFYCSIP